MKQLFVILLIFCNYKLFPQNIDSTFFTISSFKTELLKKPDKTSKGLLKIPSKDTVAVYKDYYNQPFIKVKYKNTIGYLLISSVDLNTKMRKFLDARKGIDTTEYSRNNPSNNTNSTNSNYHDYHTGPRGGVYYINSKGNKVYKSRK